MKIGLAHILLVTAFAGAAQAQTLSSATLPSFAQGGAYALAPSPLGAIGGAFAFSTPAPGHVFGAANVAGFSQKLDDKLFISVQAVSGYASSFGSGLTSFGRLGFGASGFDFTATSVKLGYDAGRFRPYVSAGFASATPVAGYGLSGPDRSLSAALNQPAGQRTTTSLGAGFDYAITGNLSFSAGVAVQSTQGAVSPFGLR